MNRDSEKIKELRSFGLVTGLLTGLLFGLFLPWLFEHEYPRWPWILTGILWLSAILYPQVLSPVSKVWLKIGHTLGWFNTRLILGLMYYTVVFFTAMVLRLLGKDPMSRKWDSSVESYRVKSKMRPKNHVERPF